MNINYFKSDRTESAIREEYLKLAAKYQPDITKGETDAVINQIALEYKFLLNSVNGEVTADSFGKLHVYKYSEERENQIIAMVRKLQNLRLDDDIEIGLIGTWIWVNGNTKPVKNQLKFIGLKWHNEKLCWYDPDKTKARFFGKSAKESNFADMAMRYGYQKIANSMKDSGKKIGA